jgi:hypothetical protein
MDSKPLTGYSVADPGSGGCFYPWIRDLKKIRSKIQDEHPGSYFLELSVSSLG